jgi:hypothetical protein
MPEEPLVIHVGEIMHPALQDTIATCLQILMYAGTVAIIVAGAAYLYLLLSEAFSKEEDVDPPWLPTARELLSSRKEEDVEPPIDTARSPSRLRASLKDWVDNGDGSISPRSALETCVVFDDFPDDPEEPWFWFIPGGAPKTGCVGDFGNEKTQEEAKAALLKALKGAST